MSYQIKIVKTERGYDGFFKVDQIFFQHTLFKGGWTPVIQRELFTRGQAVVVLLYDLDAHCVILVEQCRAGALMHAQKANQPERAWLLEPVAGMVEEGESFEKACQREVREEAGISLKRFERICQFYPSPGGSDEILHLFAAQVDSRILPEYAGLAEESEDIRLVKLSFSEVRQGLQQAKFNVASTWVTLQWLLFQSGYVSSRAKCSSSI